MTTSPDALPNGQALQLPAWLTGLLEAPILNA
jgi:hypothetical protein